MSDPSRTRDIYVRHAEGYDARRSRAFFEARWLRRFASHLPDKGCVLDLGCGTGDPITGWLIGEGFAVTGTDFAEPMLEIARNRWPDENWLLSDMRDLALGRQFDGVIGWDSFFHLTPEEQRTCLPRLAEHLKPGGVLMITVGPGEGEVSGTVEGESVYHASLSAAEYAALLEATGLRLTAYLAEDPDCDYHSILMAKKSGSVA